MSLKAKLPRLEAVARRQARERELVPFTEEDFLAEFERLGRGGTFAGESEFAPALEAYREALRDAAASDNPPFDPPPDFLPEMQSLPYLRALNWRTARRFPRVHEGLDRLFILLDRVKG
jgi:hypothetical protein